MDLASSLADRLRALGVRPASDLSPVPPKAASPVVSLEAVLEGRFLKTRRGETFLREQRYPAEYRHGSVAISIETPLEVIAAWTGELRFSHLPLEAYAFLDTETSGLAGGTGTYAFLVGVGRFENDEFHLAQFFLRDPGEEASLLEALVDFLAPCQALVTFNGKAFDAPLLTTRFQLHSIPVPFAGYAHLDLLPLARRLWRDRLPSRALKFLEENILFASRSSEEVPGYEIPYLYFDYLRTGDATPLRGVLYHNAMDVIAMVALLAHMVSLLHHPFQEDVRHSLDVVALAKLFEEIGRWELAARLFERSLEMGLPEADFWHVIRRLAHLQKRRGDLETAVHLWEKAAAEEHLYAYVELAKYYEHIRKDYATALRWTDLALRLLDKHELPPYQDRHWRNDLSHRRRRLSGRCSLLERDG
ncbi:MAG: ribonuclease H-like domain-containing protein [Anaerolineales bacterium]|nr:ribonuclease H-like domain-containing protein [Anaerolineales bacterium]MCX7608307.1 ribonuclease H-like domain-containing protein [Anaerolineales bacterium]MDW8227336.1 ribonuclease H-like domain-containing protein [Anaerolineales bacterium]